MISILPHKIPTRISNIIREKVAQKEGYFSQIANGMGIHENTLRRAMNPDFYPRLDTLLLICKGLGLNLWVVDEDGNSWRLKS